MNETAPGGGENELGRDPLTFKKGLQREEEEPGKSPEKEWAEGWEGSQEDAMSWNQEAFQ